MSSLINVGAAGVNILGRPTELGELIVVFQECALSPGEEKICVCVWISSSVTRCLQVRLINVPRSSRYRGNSIQFNSDRRTRVSTLFFVSCEASYVRYLLSACELIGKNSRACEPHTCRPRSINNNEQNALPPFATEISNVLLFGEN